MTPAEFVPAVVHEPADAGAGDSLDQPSLSRRDQRTARKLQKVADKPRPEDKSALLEWAFAEYQRLRKQGEAPDIHQWAARFPTCRSSLRQILEIEAFTAGCLDRASLLGRVPPGSADDSIPWPEEGSLRADFTIVRELARGTFARVYLATEASAGDRLVVLKCSLHGDAEARTLGRLAHPHIVPILSARIDDESGLTMVCMPYLGSATLEDVLDHFLASEVSPPSKAKFLLDVIRFRAQPEDSPPATLDPCLVHGGYTEGVIHLAAQLAETLVFLHQHGVCHRDFKPSNVLLDPSGKALLLDFNLSESEREAVVPVGGTLRYMAPEQIRAFLDRSKDGMDQRVDFYALGVMVYELLGGAHPCASLLETSVQPSLAQTLLVGLKAGFRPFRELCPELARPVAAVLDRCVAYNASDRPSDAAELAAALKRQFTTARRLRRRLAAHSRWLLATFGLLLMAFAVSAYVWAVTPPYSQREYDRGLIAYHDGDFDRAETHFDRAFRAEPNNPRFRYARGCARLQQSKYLPKDRSKLEDIRDDLTSTDQGAADPQSLAVLAYIRIRNQDFEDAIKLYDRIEPSRYRPIMVFNNRAYSNFNIRELEKAQGDLDRAVQIDRCCQAALYNRALIASRRRGPRTVPPIPPQAREDIEEALRLGPKTSALYRDAAVLYSQVAQDELDQAHLDRALSYLRQAIAAGEPQAAFEPFPALREALKLSEFSALLLAASSKPYPQQELRLIDPVEPPH